jgi:hypothetical protein
MRETSAKKVFAHVFGCLTEFCKSIHNFDATLTAFILQNTFQGRTPEVSLDDIECLPHKDQVAFSVASRATRQLALPLIFHDFDLTRSRKGSPNIRRKLRWLICAGNDVQKAIKLLTSLAAVIHLELTPLHHRIFTISMDANINKGGSEIFEVGYVATRLEFRWSNS